MRIFDSGREKRKKISYRGGKKKKKRGEGNHKGLVGN